MKWLCKILFPTAFIFGVFTAAAQEYSNSGFPISTKANSVNYKLTGRRYYFNASLSGPPYVYNGWQKGSVLLENGDRYDNLYLQFNTLTEDLIWFNSRIGCIVALDKFIIREFILDSANKNTSLFRKINSDTPPNGEHYYNVLYDGKMKLLRWYRTIEINTAESNTRGDPWNSRYSLDSRFFLVFPDGVRNSIKGNRSSLVDSFPEQKKTVRRILRKNKIKLKGKNAAELTRAVKLLDAEFYAD